MNARIQDDNSNSAGFLAGLVAGSALGAGIAFYFLEPRRAAAFCQRLTDSTAALRDSASEGLRAVATRVADVVDRVADTAEDVSEKGQAVRDDVADAVARGAREVGQYAKAAKTD